MPDAPEVWSDGSLVLDSITGVPAAGAGLFAHQSEHCWSDCRWGHVDRVQLDRVLHYCRGLVSVPGLLQTVQRAELWGSFLLFSLPTPFNVVVDNLGVVRHAGRLLDGCYCSLLGDLRAQDHVLTGSVLCENLSVTLEHACGLMLEPKTFQMVPLWSSFSMHVIERTMTRFFLLLRNGKSHQ